LLQINSAAVKGEPGTGYEPPGGKGEFECQNCEYFKDNSCGQPDMMKNSRQPRAANGRVQVDPEGCCEYVSRVGRKEDDTDSGAMQAAASFKRKGSY